MELADFLIKLKHQPDKIEFNDTMVMIDNNYHFTPTAFNNGNIKNQANQNNGSCKIFAFGLLHQLSEQQTLACFGAYYRDDVLKNPSGDDHQNIRHFINTGWNNITFSGKPLNIR